MIYRIMYTNVQNIYNRASIPYHSDSVLFLHQNKESFSSFQHAIYGSLTRYFYDYVEDMNSLINEAVESVFYTQLSFVLFLFFLQFLNFVCSLYAKVNDNDCETQLFFVDVKTNVVEVVSFPHTYDYPRFFKDLRSLRIGPTHNRLR